MLQEALTFRPGLKSRLLGHVLGAVVVSFTATSPSKVEASENTATPSLAPLIPATGHALIAIGLTADSDQASRLQKQAEALRAAFQTRGISASSIQIVAASSTAPVTKETVLGALKITVLPNEETWIVLLGQAARARGGQPAFQVSGPRLAAEELAAAVGALPGKKFVVVATSRSGGFLPALEAQPDIEAVAATGENGEINEPRFAGAWAETLASHPDATFMILAREAAARVEKFYQEKGLGQGEHARVIDRAAKTIIDVPTQTPETKPPATSP